DLDVELFPELPIDRGDVVGKENRQLAHRAGTVAAERSGTELPAVDRDVETALRPVAGEAPFDVLVGDDRRSLMATLDAVTEQRRRPTDMIEMPVGVDDRVDRIVDPGSQRAGDPLTGEGKRRVEEDEAVLGAETDDVGERFDERQPVAPRVESVRDPHRDAGRSLG